LIPVRGSAMPAITAQRRQGSRVSFGSVSVELCSDEWTELVGQSGSASLQATSSDLDATLQPYPYEAAVQDSSSDVDSDEMEDEVGRRTKARELLKARYSVACCKGAEVPLAMGGSNLWQKRRQSSIMSLDEAWSARSPPTKASCPSCPDVLGERSIEFLPEDEEKPLSKRASATHGKGNPSARYHLNGCYLSFCSVD